MLKELPTFIEPLKLAQMGCHLKGQVALTQMTRLHDSLCDFQGYAEIDWLFTMDEKHHPTILGPLQAQLTIQCQRCLQPMQWSIDRALALTFLTNKQDEELPAGYEAIILTNNPLQLIALVEDELILALPIIAKHDKCSSLEYQLPENINENVKNNPFHVLAALKNTH
jgi:uncharacterized protein